MTTSAEILDPLQQAAGDLGHAVAGANTARVKTGQAGRQPAVLGVRGGIAEYTALMAAIEELIAGLTATRDKATQAIARARAAAGDATFPSPSPAGTHDLSSGKNDEWYQQARQEAAAHPHHLRAAVRLATHLEVKTVGTPADVTRLVEELAKPGATAATIRHEQRPTLSDPNLGEIPDHDMTAEVWQGHGSPAHYIDYDAGTGIARPEFQNALVRFLQTATRPDTVEGKEAD